MMPLRWTAPEVIEGATSGGFRFTAASDAYAFGVGLRIRPWAATFDILCCSLTIFFCARCLSTRSLRVENRRSSRLMIKRSHLPLSMISYILRTLFSRLVSVKLKEIIHRAALVCQTLNGRPVLPKSGLMTLLQVISILVTGTSETSGSLAPALRLPVDRFTAGPEAHKNTVSALVSVHHGCLARSASRRMSFKHATTALAAIASNAEDHTADDKSEEVDLIQIPLQRVTNELTSAGSSGAGRGSDSGDDNVIENGENSHV